MNIGTITGTLRLVDQWTATMNRSIQSINTLQSGVEVSSQALSRLGQSLTVAVTLPLAAAGAAAFNFGKNFEASLTRIETLADESASTVARFREQVLSLSKETGRAPRELADALYYVVSSGVRGAAAMEVLTVSAKAAAIGLGDTKVVADAVTSALNAYGRESITAAEAVRVMIATVREGKGEARDIALTIGRVIPLAAELGVRFQDLGSFIAAATRIGLNAEVTVTALRGALTALIQPTKKQADAFQDLVDRGLLPAGFGIATMRKLIREEGLAEAFTVLMNAVKGNEEALNGIFGDMRALTGVLAAYGKQLGATTELQAEIRLDLDELNRGFTRVSETVDQKWNRSLSNMQVIAIRTFDALRGSFVNALDTIEFGLGVLEKLVLAFRDLPGPIRNLILFHGALAAAVGPVIMVLASLASSVSLVALAFGPGAGGLATAIAGVSAALIGLPILIAAVAAALIVLGAKFPPLRNLASDFWTGLKLDIQEAKAELDSFIGRMNSGDFKLPPVFDDILEFFRKIGPGLATLARLPGLFTPVVRAVERGREVRQAAEYYAALNEEMAKTAELFAEPAAPGPSNDDPFETEKIKDLADSLREAHALALLMGQAATSLEREWVKFAASQGLSAEQISKSESALTKETRSLFALRLAMGEIEAADIAMPIVKINEELAKAGAHITHLITPLGTFEVEWKDTFEKNVLASIQALPGGTKEAMELVGISIHDFLDEFDLLPPRVEILRQQFEALQKAELLTDEQVADVRRKLDQMQEDYNISIGRIRDVLSDNFDQIADDIFASIADGIIAIAQGVEDAAKVIQNVMASVFAAIGSAVGDALGGFGQVGGVIGGAIGAILFRSRRTDPFAGGDFGVSDGRLDFTAGMKNWHINEKINQIGREMTKVINDILESFNASIVGLSKDIGFIIDNGRNIININGVQKNFGDNFQAALEFFIIETIKAAEFSGLSPETVAMIKAAAEQAGQDLSQMQADFEAIREYNEIGVSELSRKLDELRRHYDDLAATIGRLGGDVSKITAEYERQAQLLREQAVISFGTELLAFIDKYYTSIEGGEEFRRQMEQLSFNLRMAQLRMEYDALVAIGALTAETMALAQSIFAFIDANPPTFEPPRVPGERRRQRRERREERAEELESALDTLGTPLSDLRNTFKEYSDAIAVLDDRLSRAAITQDQYNQAIGEFAAYRALEFGQGLLTFVDEYYGDVAIGENMRRQMEQLNFDLRLTALQLEYDALKALGVLGPETIAEADRVFAWFKENAPVFGEALSPAEEFLERLADAANDSRFSASSGFLGLIDRIFAMIPAGTMVQGFRLLPQGTLTGGTPGSGQVASDSMEDVATNAVRPLLIASDQLMTVEQARFEIAKAMQLLELSVIEAQLIAAGVISETGGEFERGLIDSTRSMVLSSQYVADSLGTAAGAAGQIADRLQDAADTFRSKWDALFGATDPLERIKSDLADLRAAWQQMSAADKFYFLKSQGLDPHSTVEMDALFEDLLGPKEAKLIADAIAEALQPLRDYFEELRTSRAGLTTGQRFDATMEAFNVAVASGDMAKAIQFARMLTGDVGVSQFGSGTQAFEDLVEFVVLRLGNEFDPMGPPEDLLREAVEDGVDLQRIENDLMGRLLDAVLAAGVRSEQQHQATIAALERALAEAGNVN